MAFRVVSNRFFDASAMILLAILQMVIPFYGMLGRYAKYRYVPTLLIAAQSCLGSDKLIVQQVPVGASAFLTQGRPFGALDAMPPRCSCHHPHNTDFQEKTRAEPSRIPFGP
jgi:hypothetical protein